MNPKRSTSAIPDEPGALNALVARALECWGLAGSKTDVSLVTRRENLVYRVTVANGDQRSDFALRLHRPGLRTALQLRSELAWMQAMAEAGIPVPAPLLSVHGALVETVDGFNFSLLDWIDAEPLGRESKLIQRAGAEATMVELGRQMARLHQAAAAWTPPADFDRPAWDFEGLLGEQPLWGRFWDRPELSAEQADLLARARDLSAERLRALAPPLRLIHADLIPDNVMRGADGCLHLIDFDDCCWGFREFDLATTISRLERTPDPQLLIEALLAGYGALEPIDREALPLMLALRHFTYVGWISARIGEPGAPVRARRLITAACTHAERLLQT